MALPRNLSNALEQLGSTKIKERTSALEETRLLIGPTCSNAIFDKVTRSSWLEVLNPLFSVVVFERNAFEREPQHKRSAIEKRMVDGASLLRSVVERTASQFPRKAVKALYKHCFAVVVLRKKIFRPLALDTLRTLNAVLSVKQHIDHLDDRHWLDLVRIAFSAAFDSRIRLDNDMDDGEPMLSDTESEDEASSTAKGKSRAQGASQSAVPQTQDLLESLTMLLHLLRSPNGNIVILRQASALLHKFSRLFRLIMPAEHVNPVVETTAHLPLLQAYNGLLYNLVENASTELSARAPHIWLQLSRLWPGIKTAALKEQVLIALQRMSPVIFTLKDHALKHQCCRLFYDILAAEPASRFRIGELSLSALRLRVDSQHGPKSSLLFPGIFELETICLGPSLAFNTAQAAGWALAQLAAECLFALHLLVERTGARSSRGTQETQPSSSKRRKTQDPVTELLDVLADSDKPRERVHYLQVLLFLVSRHWRDLHSDLQVRLFAALQRSTLQENVDSRAWAYCVLAAIASARNQVDISQESSASSPRPQLDWHGVWTSAVRSLSQTGVTRAAAHAARCVIGGSADSDLGSQTRESLVEPLLIRNSIKPLLDDLAVQGPRSLADSVCDLMCTLLNIGKKDAQLFQADLPSKVLSWVSNTWKPSASRATKGEWEDPVAIFRLLLCIGGLEPLQPSRQLCVEVVPPRCDVVGAAIEDVKTAPVRQFLYDCTLVRNRDDGLAGTDVEGLYDPPNVSNCSQILLLCQQGLEGLLPDEEDDERDSRPYTFEALLKNFNTLSTSLLFFGAVRVTRPQVQRGLTRVAARLLQHLLPFVSLSTWNVNERASLQSTLALLFPPLNAVSTDNSFEGLASPGPTANVPKHLQRKLSTAVPDNVLDCILREVWSTDDLSFLIQGNPTFFGTALTQLATQATSSASSASVGDTEGAQMLSQRQFHATQRLTQMALDDDSDDGFGGVRDAAPAAIKRKRGDGPRQAATSSASSSCPQVATEVSLLCVLRGFLIRPLCGTALHDDTATLDDLLLLLDESWGAAFLDILETMVKLLHHKCFDLSLDKVDSILDRLSEQFLSDYDFARNPRVSEIVIDLLVVTLTDWLPACVTEHSHLTHNARALCSWLTSGSENGKLSAWSVRLKFVTFLDAFTQWNADEEFWGDDNLPKAEDGARVLPTGVVPAMIKDHDFRVRFWVCTSSARIMEALEVQKIDITAYFYELMKAAPLNIDIPELSLTRLLCCGSLMVVMSYVRRLAYESLLDVSRASSQLNDHLHAVLEAAAFQLNVGSVSAFFNTFVQYYAIRKLATGEPDFLQQLPVRTTGFPSKTSLAGAVFVPLGALFLSTENSLQFVSIRKQAGYHTNTEGIRVCFSEYMAIALLSASTTCSGTTSTMNEVLLDAESRARATFESSEQPYSFDHFFRSSVDRVLGFVLEKLYATSFDLSSGLLQLLPMYFGNEGQPSPAALYHSLVSGVEPQTLNCQGHTFELSEGISASIFLLQRCATPESQEGIAYSVFRHLLNRVTHAAFLDDRKRLLGCIAVACILFRNHLHDPVITRLLLHGCVSLYYQPDLAQQCWSLASTLVVLHLKALHPSRKESLQPVHTIPSLLVKLAQNAQLHQASGQRPNDLNVLKSLIHKHMLLSSNGVLERQARLVLYLWPSPTEMLSTTVLDIEAMLLGIGQTRCSAVELAQAASEAVYADSSIAPEKVAQVLWGLVSCSSTASVSTPAAFALASLARKAGGRLSPPSLSSERVHRVTDGRLQVLQHRKDLSKLQEVLVTVVAPLLLSDDMTTADSVACALRNVFDNAPAGHFEAMTSMEDWARDVYALATPHLRRHVKASRLPISAHRLENIFLPKCTDLARTAHWCTQVATTLLSFFAAEDETFADFVPIVQHSYGSALSVIPPLLCALLCSSNAPTDCASSISQHLNYVLLDTSAHETTVRSIVDLMLFLRHGDIGSTANGSETCDVWLSIPWQNVALGSLRTHGASTALMCLELSKEQGPQKASEQQPNHARLMELQYQIYESVDDPDSFYSLASTDISENLTRKYKHERRFEEAYRIHGALFEAANLANPKDCKLAPVVEAMAATGFVRQASCLTDGSASDHRSVPYELAWKTGSWEIPVPNIRQAQDSSGTIYMLLRAVQQDRDVSQVTALADEALSVQAQRLTALSSDATVPTASIVSTLIGLHEVRSMLASANYAQLCTKTEDDGLPFDMADRLLNIKLSLLSASRKKEEAVQWTDVASNALQQLIRAEQCCHLQLSRSSRKNSHPDIAMRSIQAALMLSARLKDLEAPDSSPLDQSALQEEYAKVLWQKEEHSDALKLLQRVVDSATAVDSSTHEHAGKLALARSQLGLWTHEARIKSDSDIVDIFFDPACHSLDTGALGPQQQATVHFRFGTFADAQYASLLERQSEMDQLYLSQQRRKQQVSDLRSRASGSQDKYRRSQLDAAASESMRVAYDEKKTFGLFETTKHRYLALTMLQYAKVLTFTDAHDDLVYRLVGLWFSTARYSSADRRQRERIDKLHTEVNSNLATILSAKFVYLAPQLTARLSKQSARDSPPFKTSLAELVDRLTADHPYHLLYLLYNLRFSSNGAPVAGKKSRRLSSSGSSADTVAQAARAKAAEEVVNRLKSHSRFREQLAAADFVCEAYHEWADFDVRQIEGEKKRRMEGSHPMPSAMSLRKLSDVGLPVSTFHLKVDPSCRYDSSDIPLIKKYDESFKIAGGINRPKISDCIGTDGKRYKQLFKGGDDTRQDAVMEQVFELVNDLLRQDQQTSRRNLSMRTYKIIPLRAKTGMIEFVSNSQSIQDVLLPLLAKFRPRDLDYGQCRKRLAKARAQASVDNNPQSPTPDAKSMHQALLDLYKANQPVMRFKFFEAHKHGSKWFQMRLNYTRSVSVNSIVGYILGIGDRHISNLLLDTVQGELVPIDFGYAFDGGTRLAIPETVPFRLTRNIVDGFGSSGVEGTYRRCCEEIYRVLRSREMVVMTVLDVFKYDPLQRWDVSPEKMQRRGAQQTEAGTHLVPPGKPTGLERTSAISSISEDESTDVDDEEEDQVPALAEQALRVVSTKLRANGLSIEYKVNELIQQATDPARLSMIFAGWQPYA